MSGIVGSRADQVKPENFWGAMSFLVSVNFHPMWLAQILHWATVHTYPGNQLCSVEGQPIRFKLQASYMVSVLRSYLWGFTDSFYRNPAQAHNHLAKASIQLRSV